MPNTGNSKGAPGRAAERRLAAWDLYKAGRSFREIGRQLGVSEWTAHHDVHRRLHDLDGEERQQARLYRRAILDRNRPLIQATWPRAAQGDLEAMRTILLLHRELRDLLGLDGRKRDAAVDVPVNSGGARLEEAFAWLRTEAAPRAAIRAALVEMGGLPSEAEDRDPGP